LYSNSAARRAFASKNFAEFGYNVEMSTITIQDIQRDPSAFVHRIVAGETILVMRDAHPLAEIRPVLAAITQPRPFGLSVGQFTVPADFDRPLPENILKDFEARALSPLKQRFQA
jgi:antitoxin (DNA-binding transcriptional repressor) of toxin-antitoxin stability system